MDRYTDIQTTYDVIIQIKSYFYRIEKTGLFKNAIASDKSLLSSLLGLENQLSTDFIDNCEEFIHSVIYKGTDNACYLNTRIRLYDAQKYGSKNTLTDNPRRDDQTSRKPLDTPSQLQARENFEGL